jgi:predicted RNA polymerase sigma factor
VTVVAEFSTRLPVVLRTLCLLFNEGYHGASPEAAVRVELCHEAMRLVSIVLDHPVGKAPESHALLALMCLNAARLPARIDSSGDLRSLFDQDRSQWDRQLENGTRRASTSVPRLRSRAILWSGDFLVGESLCANERRHCRPVVFLS